MASNDLGRAWDAYQKNRRKAGEPKLPVPGAYRLQEELWAEMRALPQGDCEWPGYSIVFNRLQAIAYNMAKKTPGIQNHNYLSAEHITTMAVLGCGHEETMKGWLLQMIDRGWKYDDVCPFTCKCPKHRPYCER
jgi:hypothetical protein